MLDKRVRVIMATGLIHVVSVENRKETNVTIKHGVSVQRKYPFSLGDSNLSNRHFFKHQWYSGCLTHSTDNFRKPAAKHPNGGYLRGSLVHELQ